MDLSKDVFVGPITSILLFCVGIVVASSVRRASLKPKTLDRAFQQGSYRVSWVWLAIGYFQYALASLPALVLLLSPNPGLAGYIAFGSMSLAWLFFAYWVVRKLRTTFVEFTDSELRYFDGKRMRVMPYNRLVAVGVSGQNLVCTLKDGRDRYVLPLVFSGNGIIVARLRSLCPQKLENDIPGL